jgi:hypothetical protein
MSHPNTARNPRSGSLKPEQFSGQLRPGAGSPQHFGDELLLPYLAVKLCCTPPTLATSSGPGGAIPLTGPLPAPFRPLA